MGTDIAVITVDLLRAEFHGLGDGGRVDWPPSPLRLAGALTAGAHTIRSTSLRQRALTAIDRLVRAPNPTIHTPRFRPLNISATYAQKTGVPENLTAGALGGFLDVSLHCFDTSSRALKPRGGVALDGTRLVYVVEATTLDADDLESLDRAAAHVPYLGRSHDTAMLRVSSDLSDDIFPDRWVPFEDDSGGTRGWQSNSPEWMQANHEITRNMPGRSLIPTHGYCRKLTYTNAARNQTGREVHIFPLERPCPSSRIPKLMERVAHSVPPGWNAFPCVYATSPHADGRCLGVGFFGDDDAAHLNTENRTELWTATRGGPDDTAGRRVKPNRATLDARNWTAQSRTWLSATPLRAFPNLRVLDYTLRQEVRSRYGIDVEIGRAETAPFEAWHTRWPSSGFQDGLDQWWIRLRFPGMVSGPVRLGASTELGFGLFSDLPDEEGTRHAEAK